jgi:hypothetical protein
MVHATFKKRKLPFVITLLFIAMWVAGVFFNEPGRVLEQAKQICLSCIGIG